MLPEQKHNDFLKLLNSATKEELIWMNGYLNALVAGSQPAAVTPASNGTAVDKITLLYGTETGNAKKLALSFAAKARENGITPKVASMDQYRLNDLGKEKHLFVIVSTHGDGEPPAAAKKFYDHLHATDAKLEVLNYSVLALGDTAYPLFCKTGEEVDEQLKLRGAKQLLPIQKCDVDFEADANTWISRALETLKSNGHAQPSTVIAAPAAAPAKKAGRQIYEGTILGKVNLNDRGSNKETWHIELEATGVQYICGDSAGIVPKNADVLVNQIIELSGADGNKTVTYKNAEYTIRDLLTNKVNLLYLTEKQVGIYAQATGHDIPKTRMDLSELLRIYPVKDASVFESILPNLNALAPRLYTIASSPAAQPDEVHLTVLKDEFIIDNQKRHGLCSSYLSEFSVGQTIQFFIQPNRRFRLPDESKPMIMVGPGTGIAAFRSFLHERSATGASGKNWLFFGEQHFVTDFLYQTEIQEWLSTGLLTKLSVAFSRDQEQKVYVQHRMLEYSAELYQWLQDGAYFFVCGSKDPMSIQVEQTLLEIIAKEGKLDEAGAKAYLHQLEEAGRYEKDVY